MALLFLLMGQLSPFDGESRRQHLLGTRLHARHGRPRSNPGCRSAQYVGRGVEVVARDAIRSGFVMEAGDRTNRHHLAAGVTDLEARDLVPSLSEGFIALGKNLESAAQIVEVVHILRAEIKLQGGEDV